jgi:hypothetical protein
MRANQLRLPRGEKPVHIAQTKKNAGASTGVCAGRRQARVSMGQDVTGLDGAFDPVAKDAVSAGQRSRQARGLGPAEAAAVPDRCRSPCWHRTPCTPVGAVHRIAGGVPHDRINNVARSRTGGRGCRMRVVDARVHVPAVLSCPEVLRTRTLAVMAPKGVAPLNRKFARPSQQLRKLRVPRPALRALPRTGRSTGTFRQPPGCASGARSSGARACLCCASVRADGRGSR